MKKRIISLLLVIMLVIGLPAVALAGPSHPPWPVLPPPPAPSMELIYPIYPTMPCPLQTQVPIHLPDM